MPDEQRAVFLLAVRGIRQHLGQRIPKDSRRVLKGDAMLLQVGRRLGWIPRELEIVHRGGSVSPACARAEPRASGNTEFSGEGLGDECFPPGHR